MTNGPTHLTKKLHIKTYGCQMNVYDSDRMAEVLAPIGYGLWPTADEADLIILNTCHIREKAAEKLYSDLGRLRPKKVQRAAQDRPLILAVAGCVAQAEGVELLRRAPFVDVVVGPQTYHRLPELLASIERGSGAIVATEFPRESKFDQLPEERAGGQAAAFLAVQEGCDKFCSFCVVPYTRGAEFSRPMQDLLAEARRLVDSGAREIILLGQNVNAYHSDGSALADLIRSLVEIEGLERIRYTTSHPVDMSDDLIAAHAELPQLMPFLHLPVQSGSDRILSAMNRGHTVSDYRNTVDKLRRARPDIALSSDFIVGFPGESEADFEATLSFCEEVDFIQAYSFKFSARPGTPAAGLEDQVPESVKSERLARLQALLESGQTAFNGSCVGRVMPVLFERPGRHPGQLVGRSPYMQPVHAAVGSECLGQIAQLRIVEAHPNSLAGVPSDRGEYGLS